MKTTVHGGDLGEVRRRFPDAPQPWIDLSTGINPVAYPVPALPEESWTRLPTRDAGERLLAAAGARYGVRDPATIVAAPGTQALIQLLPRLVPKSRVAILGPTYEEHALCWAAEGHELVEGDAEVTVVVNPNNPTGRLLTPAELRNRRGLLVVDEAFMDFLSPEASLAPDPPSDTIVLRSFGKAYGLAGVRLGFAIAAKGMIDCLRQMLGPWAVSGPALEIGRRALEDSAWLQASARRLDADSRRLDALLVGAGFEIEGGTSLFRLARHRDASGMAARLGRHGIHVRAFARQPNWLRFGLPGSEADFDRLARAVAS